MAEPNAYTVGSTESYEEAFRTQERVLKVGPCVNADVGRYDGGCAFRTREEAQAYVDSSGKPYSVYGLLLPVGWDFDVSKEPIDGFHRILRDVEVVRLRRPARDRVDSLLEHGISRPEKWAGVKAYEDPSACEETDWRAEWHRLRRHHEEEMASLYELLKELAGRLTPPGT